uniref:Uncharacterized protein n=1 Tax=Anguilla anguilla TaxID=7936 RepID=A0A0E9QN29_ANGAN
MGLNLKPALNSFLPRMVFPAELFPDPVFPTSTSLRDDMAPAVQVE